MRREAAWGIGAGRGCLANFLFIKHKFYNKVIQF